MKNQAKTYYQTKKGIVLFLAQLALKITFFINVVTLFKKILMSFININKEVVTTKTSFIDSMMTKLLWNGIEEHGTSVFTTNYIITAIVFFIAIPTIVCLAIRIIGNIIVRADKHKMKKFEIVGLQYISNIFVRIEDRMLKVIWLSVISTLTCCLIAFHYIDYLNLDGLIYTGIALIVVLFATLILSALDRSIATIGVDHEFPIYFSKIHGKKFNEKLDNDDSFDGEEIPVSSNRIKALDSIGEFLATLASRLTFMYYILGTVVLAYNWLLEKEIFYIPSWSKPVVNDIFLINKIVAKVIGDDLLFYIIIGAILAFVVGMVVYGLAYYLSRDIADIFGAIPKQTSIFDGKEELAKTADNLTEKLKKNRLLNLLTGLLSSIIFITFIPKGTGKGLIESFQTFDPSVKTTTITIIVASIFVVAIASAIIMNLHKILGFGFFIVAAIFQGSDNTSNPNTASNGSSGTSKTATNNVELTIISPPQSSGQKAYIRMDGKIIANIDMGHEKERIIYISPGKHKFTATVNVMDERTIAMPPLELDCAPNSKQVIEFNND